MKSELQFLLNCCQTLPPREIVASIRSQLASVDSSWLMTISQLAHNHGVFPLFCKSLNDHTADLISEEAMQELRLQNLIIVRDNMLLSAELLRITKLLAENGIAALAFKGPTLAQLVYGDIALREYGDLDILVSKKDIVQVDALLKILRYQRSLDLTPFQEKIWFDRAHDLGFHHPDRGIQLEMHWSLMNEDYPLQFELGASWNQPNPVIIDQQEINTFADEELLIYLLIHGSKHLWERIEWIKDIDLLVRSRKLDWQKIMDRVEGSGFELMVFLGLYLAGRLFATKLPAAVADHLAVYQKLPDLSQAVTMNWSEPHYYYSLASNLKRAGLRLQLLPDLKLRLLYLHNILIKPSFNEYWLIDLPRPLYWLYYFIRPVMLLKKYIKNWWVAH